MESALDKIHSCMVRSRWAQLFTAFTRCLLGVAFIPPSIPKILHKPFTILGSDNPVGAYFHALYNTGFYYEFLGWSQIAAALLLLIPRTSHIGALVFLPIIVNIAVLTSSVGFSGTWLITLLMSLAALWLTAWEYDRLKPIMFMSRADRPEARFACVIALPIVFALGGGILSGVAWSLRLGNLADYRTFTLALVCIGAVFGLVVAMHFRSMPVGKLR